MSPYRGGEPAVPSMLICAGLDPSGGAGILADARIAAQLGIRPVGVVTALTVQDTTGVRACSPIDPELLGDQLVALLSDIEVRAVKIGMVGSVAVARAIAKALELTHAESVWDPVMDPTRGLPWNASERFVDAFEALAGHVRLVTPNARELAALTGRTVETHEHAVAAATEISQRYGVLVLAKGGHLDSLDDESVDYLVDGDDHKPIAGPRILHGEEVHGTGCALSTAIAAGLATNAALIDACRMAKRFVYERIANPVQPGRGAPSVV